MSYHLYYIAGMSPSDNTAVRTNGTDVLIIFANHVRQMKQKPNVWLDVGLSSNNTRRFFNVTKLAECDITEGLPSLHACTGCDVTAAFINKGNVKPLELSRKHRLFQDTFSKSGNEMDTEH